MIFLLLSLQYLQCQPLSFCKIGDKLLKSHLDFHPYSSFPDFTDGHTHLTEFGLTNMCTHPHFFWRPTAYKRVRVIWMGVGGSCSLYTSWSEEAGCPGLMAGHDRSSVPGSYSAVPQFLAPVSIVQATPRLTRQMLKLSNLSTEKGEREGCSGAGQLSKEPKEFL